MMNNNPLKKPIVWLILGGITLAVHPLNWLVTTWFDPAYDSNGLWIMTIVVGLFLWSWQSPVIQQSENNHAILLLSLSAVTRLVGQLLAINTFTALTLVIDVYALANIANLKNRSKSVSPFWLAILFALSLPLERILQRTLGYGFQQVSAWGACNGLNSIVDNVICEGVRIIIAGQDVLVDLPCSGARGLLLLLMVFVVLATVHRPTIKHAIIGLVLWGLAALLSNTLRIILLALGIAFPNLFFSIDVMSSPWHDVIGLISLVFGLLPLVFWVSYFLIKRASKPSMTDNGSSVSQYRTINSKYFSLYQRLILSIFFFLFAWIITILPASPVDISRVSSIPTLPSNLLGVAGTIDSLSNQEQTYFRLYGGGAERRQYGSNALLMVKTSAPLRHLHTPNECLRGMGHDVEYVGFENKPIPTAVYRSTDPNGNQWQIRVSFRSDNNHSVHSVAEAVWFWIQQPKTTWYQIQRISPWQQQDSVTNQFDNAVMRALDIPIF